jgi:hypothetical protein
VSEENDVEIERVQVRAEGCSADRAERVTRLIFSHLHTMLAQGCLRPGARRVVPHLHVPSLEVDWDEMDDDAIARQGAAWVYRWLQTTAG